MKPRPIRSEGFPLSPTDKATKHYPIHIWHAKSKEQLRIKCIHDTLDCYAQLLSLPAEQRSEENICGMHACAFPSL